MENHEEAEKFFRQFLERAGPFNDPQQPDVKQAGIAYYRISRCVMVRHQKTLRDHRLQNRGLPPASIFRDTEGCVAYIRKAIKLNPADTEEYNKALSHAEICIGFDKVCAKLASTVGL